MKHRHSILPLLASTLLASAVSQGAIIISEIVDATLPGGLPKFVELTNTGTSSIDLSTIWIGNFNNGDTLLSGGAASQLSGTIAAGDSFVVSYENGDTPGNSLFNTTYGFDANNLDLGAFYNGDDVLAIFDGPATGDGSNANILDVYGVVGTDGTGEAWEYTDGFSFRNPSVTGGAAVFNPAEWTVGGANSLETGDDITEAALIVASTTPGSHAFVPEPTITFLGGLALLAFLRRGRGRGRSKSS